MSKPQPKPRPTIVATQGKKTTMWVPIGAKPKGR